jgi:uncharacterized lipoprotein
MQLLLDTKAVCGTMLSCADTPRTDYITTERMMDMPAIKKNAYLFWPVLTVMLIACACARDRVAPDLNARVYHKPYDAVWEAVTAVLLDELGCVERKTKKSGGYLETEWVNTLDTSGQSRWKIEAYLKQRNGAVTVYLEKTVQMKDTVSKTIRKYNNEEKKEPVGPHAGWSNTATNAQEIEDLYRRIDLRLGG